ncbi:hypothetical protein LZ023_15765 [Pseudomonas silvicola]|nr:hypothetical protein LZ023_15765 [Pseudomonas silvicola]
MLGWMLDRTKMARIAGKWIDAAGIDPGDRGQVAAMAHALMKASGMRAEDAWLSCLSKWMLEHPNARARTQLALGMNSFLDIYEHSAGLHPESRVGARFVADTILEEGHATPSNQQYNLAPQPSQSASLTPAQNDSTLDRATTQLPGAMESSPPVYSPDKAVAFDRALQFLRRYLRQNGYALHWVAKTRADTPSIEAAKDGVVFHIVLHASNSPVGRPAPFMIDRCVEHSAKKGGVVRIARVGLASPSALTQGEFVFSGLESLADYYAGLKR